MARSKLKVIWISLAISILFVTLVPHSAHALDCSPGWDLSDSVVAEQYSVPLVRMFGTKVIESFAMNRLLDADGELLRARNLADAVCMLELMLAESTKTSIRRGLEEFMEASPDNLSVDEAYRLLERSINRRLHDLYGNDGLQPDGGISAIIIEIGFQNEPDVNSPYLLLEDARLQGIYVTNGLARWVWYHYLNTLAVDGFSSAPFVSRLKAFHQQYGPPTSAIADECAEPISFQWPKYIGSPFGAGRLTAHWGICRSRAALFYFHHDTWRNHLDPEELSGLPDIHRIDGGWRMAGPREVEYFCRSPDRSGEFFEYCMRQTNGESSR